MTRMEPMTLGIVWRKDREKIIVSKKAKKGFGRR